MIMKHILQQSHHLVIFLKKEHVSSHQYNMYEV